MGTTSSTSTPTAKRSSNQTTRRKAHSRSRKSGHPTSPDADRPVERLESVARARLHQGSCRAFVVEWQSQVCLHVTIEDREVMLVAEPHGSVEQMRGTEDE